MKTTFDKKLRKNVKIMIFLCMICILKIFKEKNIALVSFVNIKY